MRLSSKLNDLTTAEKIGVMEYLWDDLCRRASKSLSPSWHGEVLAAREEAVESGDENFIDWEDAKKKIRESL